MVRTRFAPSPTGYLHIGSLRTALYAYAWAKSQKGKFVLRIEDTDRKRFVPGAIESLCKMLRQFGVKWDEGPEVGGPYAPYIQSERVASGIYRECAERLVKQGQAYYCFCPPQTTTEIKASQAKKELKLRDQCRELDPNEAKRRVTEGEKTAIRLRLPAREKVGFYDFVRQRDITWRTEDVDEVTLLKSDGFPTYQLAVVVDDAVMKISHVIRAHEWLPSTPVQIVLFKYLGWPVPEIGHVTDMLDPEGGKLSKRRRNVSCEDYLNQGYLAEAILNYVMLCGWAPKDNRETYTLAQFVESFRQGELQVANAMFNPVKLNWFNGQYIRKKTEEQLAQLLKPFAPAGLKSDLIKETVPLVKERLIKLSDYADLVVFLVKEPVIDWAGFADKVETKEVRDEQLKQVRSLLEVTNGWQAEKLEVEVRELAERHKWQFGPFFMAVRVAVTGRSISPPLFGCVELLGREKTVLRLSRAISF
jgi:glutamyl-tRNA synthetase